MYRTFHYLDILYYVSCIVFADFILVYWVCQSDCSTFDIGQTHLVCQGECLDISLIFLDLKLDVNVRNMKMDFDTGSPCHRVE